MAAKTNESSSSSHCHGGGSGICNWKKRNRLCLLSIAAVVLVIVATVATLLLFLLLPRSTVVVAASKGSYILLETVPHDPSAFTQGLELVPDNALEYFESTGLYGQSSVRRVDLTTGQVLQQSELAPEYFGEGLTYFDGKLLQITWREERAFVYNATDLTVLDEFRFNTSNGEGWGICYVETDGIFLVTDGSSNLHRWDASTYKLMDKIPVAIRSDADSYAERVDNLNELEWDFHSKTVLANIWQEDFVVRIDSETGSILAKYDLGRLDRPPEADVLNGIAVTDIPNEIWVTGKLWPSIYLIRLIGR